MAKLSVRLLLTINMCFSAILVLGQQFEKEQVEAYKLEYEHFRQFQMSQQLDSAISLLKQEKYAAADIKFMNLLDHMKKIPSNMVYYFGVNSFHIGKYTQSLDWLNKYIQIKGTGGSFSERALKWMKKAEYKLANRNKEEVKNSIPSRSQSYIDCDSIGKIVCPACKGYGVLIERKYGENVYKNCTYCHDHGYIECDQYNETIRKKVHYIHNN